MNQGCEFRIFRLQSRHFRSYELKTTFIHFRGFTVQRPPPRQWGFVPGANGACVADMSLLKPRPLDILS
jgi:hypothetical protein